MSPTRFRACALLLAIVSLGSISSHARAQQSPLPTFRASMTVVSVDVVVRDGAGAIVRDLTAQDFTVFEDGRRQAIQTFALQEIHDRREPSAERPRVFDGVEEQWRHERERTPRGTPATPLAPLAPDAFAGRRLIVLLFDVSSMQDKDVRRAVDSAITFTREGMSASDLVAVVTIGASVDVLTDFTSDVADVESALARVAAMDARTDPSPQDAEPDTDQNVPDKQQDAGFSSFNNDVRLRALKVLSDALAGIEQKKAFVYFSTGMARNGADNRVELRAAVNAAVRAHAAIYAVDVRGLQAVVPGGDASKPSGRGLALFTGEAVQRQFNTLSSSHETLTTLASDTGGRAFIDTNSFGEAMARAQLDLSAYYLIGYATTNRAKDGRFRRIDVRVNRPGARVEARAGYYADRDFEYTSKRDRDSQLEEYLVAAVPPTDLPLILWTGSFRHQRDRFFVPIALAMPGTAVPVPAGAQTVGIDVRAVIRDDAGRTVGHLRDTLQVPAGSAATLAGTQVMYQSGVILPAGRFSIKVVARENTSGVVGSFEAPLVVPTLEDAPVKLSSIVFSTQLGARPAGEASAYERLELVPNLTHVVTSDQTIRFYYEVYDPATSARAMHLRTSLSFFRGTVKVYETALAERTVLDDPTRGAAVFRFEIPGRTLTPGTYICQVSVIDSVSEHVAFARLSFVVSPG